MTESQMPAFRGRLPKPLDLAQVYQFADDAEFVAVHLLAGDEPGQRTIMASDGPFICKIDLFMRRAHQQHVIDVTMCLLDDKDQPKEPPEKVAEIRLIPEAARACRAELYVDRSAFVAYHRFLDWLWLVRLIADWREKAIHQDEASNSGQRQPSGRPRNPDDDWAWQQVNALERPPAEVYSEWIKRIGNRAQALADLRDSFRKAIKPNRGKKRGKKE